MFFGKYRNLFCTQKSQKKFWLLGSQLHGFISFHHICFYHLVVLESLVGFSRCMWHAIRHTGEFIGSLSYYLDLLKACYKCLGSFLLRDRGREGGREREGRREGERELEGERREGGEGRANHYKCKIKMHTLEKNVEFSNFYQSISSISIMDLAPLIYICS